MLCQVRYSLLSQHSRQRLHNQSSFMKADTMYMVVLAQASFKKCGRSNIVCNENSYCAREFRNGRGYPTCLFYKTKGAVCDARVKQCSPGLVCKEKPGLFGGIKYCLEPPFQIFQGSPHAAGFPWTSIPGTHQTNTGALGGTRYVTVIKREPIPATIYQGLDHRSGPPNANPNQGIYPTNEDSSRAALYGAFLKGAIKHGNQGLEVRKLTPNVNPNQDTSSVTEIAHKATIYDKFMTGDFNQGNADAGLHARNLAANANPNQGFSPMNEDSSRAALYGAFLKGAMKHGNQGLEVRELTPNANPNQDTSSMIEIANKAAIYDKFMTGAFNQGNADQGIHAEKLTTNAIPNQGFSSINEDSQRAALYGAFLQGAINHGNQGLELRKVTHEANPNQGISQKKEDEQRAALYGEFLKGALKHGTPKKGFYKIEKST